jgi:hypothetical protein
LVWREGLVPHEVVDCPVLAWGEGERVKFIDDLDGTAFWVALLAWYLFLLFAAVPLFALFARWMRYWMPL